MESLKLARPQGLGSKENISNALSKNLLQVVLEFSDLNTLPKLTRLNRKFKSVISDKTRLPIFTEYIEERKKSNRIQYPFTRLFRVCNYSSYISKLSDKLARIYSHTQVNNFLTEITNRLLRQWTHYGKFYLEGGLFQNPQTLKILSEAFKVNKAITELSLTYKKIGDLPENLKILSEALKVNQSITKLHLGSSLGEDEIIKLRQIRSNLDISLAF
jgi:hypothetical protein